MAPPQEDQQQQQPVVTTTDVGSSEDTTIASDTLQQPFLSSSPSPSPQSNDDNTDDSKDILIGNFRMNHNVFLNLVLAVLYGISNSLWNGSAYAAYLKNLGGNKNSPLGNIEAASGAASLITALPIGYLADKIGRSKVIRVGGILLLVTCILQICVMEWVGTDEVDDDNDENDDYEHNDNMFGSTTFNRSFKVRETPISDIFLNHIGKSSSEHTTEALWIMGALMVLWGLADGVVGGPCQALFADSVAEGERTDAYNILFICYCAASACGPLVSIVLFQTLGDKWDLYHLRMVIYVGLGIEIFNAFLMMLFDDAKALDEIGDSDDGDISEREGVGEGDEVNGIGPACGEISASPPSVGEDRDRMDGSPSQNEITRSNSNCDGLTALQQRQRWIPYLVFAQGLIFAIGSGMTVKFFPLFFKDEVGMSPSQVQIIYTIVPAVMIVCSTACTKISGSGFGRVQTMLVFSCLGVSLLYAMVFFKVYLDKHPFLLVPIYVLRTAFMNATYPIQESILMDFVPKHERARWKSLDSVASFGWCGSAALGGWLADKFDYTYTFLITAVLQSIGIVVWSFLLPLVPRKEGARVMEEEENSGNQTNETFDPPPSEELENTLTRPLLANE